MGILKEARKKFLVLKNIPLSIPAFHIASAYHFIASLPLRFLDFNAESKSILLEQKLDRSGDLQVS